MEGLTQACKMSQIDPSMLITKAFCNLINLPHHATSILTQLQTGHIVLHIFKATKSVLWPHCQKLESVSHYLLFCKKFTDACHQLRFKVGKVAISLLKLLSS